MKNGATEQYFAEIVQSSINQWKAICWNWNQIPEFGSIVSISQHHLEYLAIVSGIETGSGDPGRIPFPYQKTFEQLEREQPQIFELLQTTFDLVPLGYLENQEPFNLLPPRPPLIHSFVSFAPHSSIKKLCALDRFLSLLFSSEVVLLQELVVCLIRFLKKNEILTEEILHEIFLQLSNSGLEYKKLRMAINKVEQLI